MTSIYSIAEKCQVVIGPKVGMQVIISSVVDSYAVCVKKAWFEGKADGDGSISGVFIYPFKNLVPVKDTDYDLFYIDVPSSYLQLPHQMGINSVSFMKGQNDPFILTGAASFGIDNTSLAGCLGGWQTYFVEGSKMYFPKMTQDIVNSDGCKILLKLTIALDTVDVEEQLNVPPNIVNDIVVMVSQPYMQKTNPVEKIQEDLN